MAVHGCCRGRLARRKHLGHARKEAFEAEGVENAGQVIAERHRLHSPRIEAGVSVEGMLSDGGPVAHLLAAATSHERQAVWQRRSVPVELVPQFRVLYERALLLVEAGNEAVELDPLLRPYTWDRSTFGDTWSSHSFFAHTFRNSPPRGLGKAARAGVSS